MLDKMRMRVGNTVAAEYETLVCRRRRVDSGDLCGHDRPEIISDPALAAHVYHSGRSLPSLAGADPWLDVDRLHRPA